MLSNTATPYYYGLFRDAVLRGDIPVCQEISMQMNLIDQLIEDPRYYYDRDKVEGFISFCENELTLADGDDLYLLDSFKLWAEDVLGWYYFKERTVFEPFSDGPGGRYVTKKIQKRLRHKQYLIVARGAAKSMYGSGIHGYFLNVDTSTTSQITTAPTMKQADEVMSPLRTAITRAKGPLFKFLTDGSIKSSSHKTNCQKLYSSKEGIKNDITGSMLEVRPMSIDKIQGSRAVVWTIDEWLSGDIREDIVGAAEQGASKNEEYLILGISSEGTARNGPGDTIKMELLSILKQEYNNPHVSIWWYKLDNIDEVNDPSKWVKAQPNIGLTVSYETYHLDVERAEKNPASRNDILAKRFGLPMEGYTWFFTYEETMKTLRKQTFWKMPCSLGADLSQGDDFCSFAFLFPLQNGTFGIKTRNYISSRTLAKLPLAMRCKYDEFIDEGSLIVLEGTILDMMEIYEDLDRHIMEMEYDILSFGFDPYNAKEFVERWVRENGQFGVDKVIQGAKTESVPLGELKKMAEDSLLIFDEEIMSFAMGNCITVEDTNGNRKLLKKHYENKIDPVSALMDAYVSYKANKDAFY